MDRIDRKEFNKIYKEKFEPVARELEPQRIENNKRKKALFRQFLLFAAIVAVVAFFVAIHYGFPVVQSEFLPLMVISVIYLFKYSNIVGEEREVLKKELVARILKAFGNIYFSGSNTISLDDVRIMGLFPRATSKSDDDVIAGVYEGCNFALDECRMTHTEGSGKHRHTVTDFDGIIVKIQMQKKFTGKTVVGVKGMIKKLKECEEVKLESSLFAKNKVAYSTDQIEARYILTPSLIERLEQLGKNFNTAGVNLEDIHNPVDTSKEEKSGVSKFFSSVSDYHSEVSAAFFGGYAYIFIPNYEDLFEIDTGKSLLNPEQYYKIYIELISVLNIITYLKFDQKTGL